MTGAVPGTRASRTLRALLAELIDYAGLFPPAALSLDDAVDAYGGYLASADAWALGRFVISAARLPELDPLLRSRRSRGGTAPPWRISALLSEACDLDTVATHNERSGALARVDCVEIRASDATAIEAFAAHVPAAYERYVELSPSADLSRLLSVTRETGVAAKIRTGGITADAFPSAGLVLRFLVACRDAGVAFKATAGLHHAVRGEHPLTYAPNATCGTMFGFLNIVLAASALHGGADPAVAMGLLEERRADLLEVSDDGIRWGQHELSLEALASARAHFVRAVGSCSFREPLDDLAAIGAH